MSSFSIILSLAFLIVTLRLLRVEFKHGNLKQSHQHLQTLLNNIPDLTWIKNKDSRFLFINDQFSKIFDLPKKEIIGRTDFDICSDIEQAQNYHEDDLKTQKERKIYHTEEQITAADGTIGWAETIKMPIFDKHNQVVGTAGMARDITKRKRVEQKMAYLAYHDSLTGLPNRAGFNQQFTKLLNLNNCAVAIILFDLDNFKTINDSLGHSCGDQTLIQITERLTSLIDENTIVARLSGDEFVVAHNYARFEDSLAKLQNTLLQKFEDPFLLNEIIYKVNASFGVAVAPQDGRDYETLLQHADLAMYQSKLSHSKTCVRFMPEFADELLYKMQLSHQLDQGIKKQQFSLLYQPKIDSKAERLVGIEALLRWKTDNNEFIPPHVFIPIAEKNGFILELGNWVINNALQQIRSWLDTNIDVPPVSINVSAAQLRQPHFADYLLGQLEHYQVAGNLLQIELTESVLMENMSDTIPQLQQIRNKGVLVNIDDFGTGYSNLSYLPTLPVDTLKIDRSFISNLHLNTDNQKIVLTIVSLADNFNLSVIAEGVETNNELAETNKCGVNNIQGYFYSYPLSVADLETHWLDNITAEKMA